MTGLLPDELIVAWWRWFLPAAVQGTVLLGIVAVVDLLLPAKTWPQLRRALWILASLKLVLPPSLVSPFSLPGLGRVGGSSELVGAFAGALDPAAVATAPERYESLRVVATGVVELWLAVALLTGGLLVLRHMVVRRRWSAAASAEEGTLALAEGLARRLGLRRVPRIVVDSEASGPFVLGVWRPIVVLPEGWSSEETRIALAHELAHLRRRDLHVSAATTALATVYWFHPLVWWARRRLEEWTEVCCDRTALAAANRAPGEYRRVLLRAAARRLGVPVPGLGLGLRRRGSFLRRLDLLERADHDRPWLRRAVSGALAAFMMAVVLPMAPKAEARSLALADLVERPPGCLPLRHLVLLRLAAEDGFVPPEAGETASESGAVSSPTEIDR